MKRTYAFLLFLLITITISGCTNENEESPDITAPVITGIHNMQCETGDDTPNYLDGVLAMDDIDGDITSSIVIDSTAVDMNTEGTYTVIVSVVDSSENLTTETFTVTIIEGVPDYETLALSDIADIELPASIGLLTEAFTLDLPDFGENGTNFTWSSNKPTIISNNGFVLNPPVGSNNTTVTLTVTATLESYTTTDTYSIVVQATPESTITSSKVIPVSFCSNVYATSDINPSALLHFVNDGNVPYMNIFDYLHMMRGVFDTSVFTEIGLGTDVIRLEYDPIIERYIYFAEAANLAHPALKMMPQSSVTSTSPENKQYIEFDFEGNDVTVSSYLFFQLLGTIKKSSGADPVRITSTIITQGDPVTIPLGDFNVDLITKGEGTLKEYYAPFHILDLIFLNGLTYKNYYNGDAIIGGDYCILDDAESIVTSSYNGENIPYDVRVASFNLYRLALDYFSSIKHYRHVSSYYDLLAGRAESLITAGNLSYYSQYTDLVMSLDDMHAQPVFNGYYANNPTNVEVVVGLDMLRTNRTRFVNYRKAYRDQFNEKFSDLLELPLTRLIDGGKTAVIHFYEFTYGMSDIFEEELDNLPTSVENVVVDVSYNGGGDVLAIFRMLGRMTDDDIIFHIGHEINETYITYETEIDEKAFDFNWYILISYGSYSAANAFPQFAKENGIATIIGEQAAGGASSLQYVILPCGYVYTLSGNHTFYYASGDAASMTSFEHGTEVDIPMVDILDDEELIDVINQHQSQ